MNDQAIDFRQLTKFLFIGQFDGINVGADIIRPTVECYEFAENQCGIVIFYRRAVNNRPYNGYGTSNRQTGIGR